MKTRQLTFQQHVDNGLRLRQAWAYLKESQRAMNTGMNKSTRSVRLMDRAVAAFDAMRGELDNQIGRDCPNVDNDALNHVYFGFRLEGQK